MAQEISNKTVSKIAFKKTLPELKDQAHKYFDMIWQLGYMKRNELYIWFADWLGVEEPKAHMSNMDEDLCEQVIEGAVMLLNDMRRLDLDFGAPIKHPYYEIITPRRTAAKLGVNKDGSVFKIEA